MTTQTVHEGLESLPPADRDYAASLYVEGLGIGDPVQRTAHFDEVRLLMGDLALYEALGAKVNEDLAVANANAELLKTRRAQNGVERIEAQGFAVAAPDFSEQVADISRTATFDYARGVSEEEKEESAKTLTETEGLRELHGFLSRFLTATQMADGSFKYPDVATQAKSILENLTFIGEREYEEAALGLAHLWKGYLDGSPDRQLCVLAKISDSDKYPGQRKSDEYLRDRVLQTFTDEELEEYSGRIVSELGDVTSDPQDTRVVLLDDWTISGTQLRREYAELSKDPNFLRFKNAGSIEANLLVASEGRIKNGLLLDPDELAGKTLKVRSYYQSHNSGKAAETESDHITGLHSSVNFGFEEPINKGMVKILARMNKMRKREPLISIANVVRPYRSSKSVIEISRDALVRNPQEVSV